MKSLSLKQLLLVDAIGAMVTASLLGQIVARFEDFFGMPSKVSYILAMVAALFAIYSFIGHFLWKGNLKTYLTIIMIANLGYCLATSSLIFTYWHNLSVFGIVYFIGEIFIILALVRTEFFAIRGA